MLISRKTMEEYGEVLTVMDVCNILLIGKTTCYKLLQENKINHFRIGNSIKIPKVCLVEYIFKNCNGG